MLVTQSDYVLLYIFSFVPPQHLCSSCMTVNYRYFPFLLPQSPLVTCNVKEVLMKAVTKDSNWRLGKYNSRHYFEAYRGTLLINMSLCGNLLATSTNDHLVKIWDISYLDNPATNDEKSIWRVHPDLPVKVYGGHVASPKALQLDSDILISGGMDKINIWNVQSNRLMGILEEASRCHDLCFSSSTLVNTSDSTLQVWDLNCTSLVNILEPPAKAEIREIKMKENMIVSISRHDIHTWDMRAGNSINIKTEQGLIDCLEYDGNHTIIYNTADAVKFIDIRTCKQTQTIDVESNFVCTLFLEGNKLILGEDPVLIRAFDIRDVSQPLFSLKTSRTPFKVRSYNQVLVCGARAWGVNAWGF